MRLAIIVILVTVAAAIVGCGTSAPLAVPNLRDAGLSTCSAAKDPLHPLIVEWQASSRAELEAAAQRGPVIVSYEGCNLRVLRACTVRDAGHYDFVATAPATQRVELSTTADLYANLPLSVASLEAKLARSNGLSLTYVAVGERRLDGGRAPTLLDGDCEGASHYVDAMVLGAFDLAAHTSESGSAKVKAGGLSAAGSADTKRELDGSAGDVALCKQRGLATGASCQSILSLALSPLHRVGKVLSGDVPGLAVIPALGSLETLREGKFDLTLLELIERARKLDGDDSAPSRAKATAWNALAQRDGGYRVAAEQRRDDWLRIADAQEQSLAKIFERCPAYEADKRRLARVRALSDELVSEEKRTRLQHTFDLTYGGWTAELATCPAPRVSRDGMANIPGGAFIMGVARSTGRYINYSDHDDAGPAHRVALSDFAMDVTEVTVAAYRRCVAAAACTAPLAITGCTWASAKGDLPINCVDREQARAYCHWADKRLPTEEEWEYAAHPNATSGPFPWGLPTRDANDLPQHACWFRESHGICPVGSKPGGASPFGLLDMAGNVWEWTDSPYTADYNGEQVSSLGVIRGGAYSSPVPEMLEVTYRGTLDPHRRVPWVGLRCARS